MTAEDFVQRLEGVTKSANGWDARCPAHEDRRASLSVSNGQKGVVLNCHAGCKAADVCAALDLKVSDLFNGSAKNGHHSKPEIVATYDYVDEAGKLLFQVCRFDPKDFRQRRPDPDNGSWIWKMTGVRRVPYRLPELIEAVADGRPVFVVEGEKDADALAKLGFVATCNPGGAGKWKSDFAEFFAGADVVIIPDRDAPGRQHAVDIKAKLASAAKSIKIVELAAGKDAADWIAAGGEAAELDELVQAAPTAKAIAEKPANPWLERIRDGSDLVKEELPPVVEIVAGIIAEQSKLLIGSGSKSFKTWLTMDMALSIAHGVPWMGRTTTRRRVLYSNLELKPDSFTRRIQTLAATKRIEVEPGWFFHLPVRGAMAGLDVEQIVSRLIEAAQRHEAEVVVVDPVYKVNVDGEENNSRDQTLLFNQLDRITTEAKATLILNDHFGKGNQSEKDPLDTIRGSSAKGGDVDAAMVLRRHEVQDCFRVDVIHRELPPIEAFCIGWTFPLFAIREDLDVDAMKKAAAGRRKAHDPKELLLAIIDHDDADPVTISTWAELAGLKRQTLTDYLPEMRRSGWVVTIGEGTKARQAISPKGKEFARS